MKHDNRKRADRLDRDIDRLLGNRTDSAETGTEPELESLLDTARQLRALPRLEPSEAAVDRCLARLDRAELGSSGRRHGFARRRLRLVWTACAVLLLVAMGGYAAATAHHSLPGELMYPAKRAAEQVRLLFTTSPEGRVQWCLLLSERRLDELVALARAGEVDPSTLNAMLTSSRRALKTAGGAEPERREVLLAQVGQSCSMQGQMLEDIKQWISTADTARINAAITECLMRCSKCCLVPGDRCPPGQ